MEFLPLGKPPHRDDLKDQFWIKEGICFHRSPENRHERRIWDANQ